MQSRIFSGIGGAGLIEVHGDSVVIQTKTLYAIFQKGLITTLRSNAGESFIEISDGEVDKVAPLELLYASGPHAELGRGPRGQIECRSLSDTCAEIRFSGWHADGVITLTEDEATGDLIVDPAAFSARPGVCACRWNVSGVLNDLELVAPFFQGVKLSLGDSLLQNTHWSWPHEWEAGLLILQGRTGGFWIHTEDTQYRYKSVQLGKNGAGAIGLESWAYGPVDNNLSAGGLSWKINVYTGDWQVPAATYRQWWWEAYGLQKVAETRAPWTKDVSMAISWCPNDVRILEALAKNVPPEKVLIHFPYWRTDAYDQHYPNYVATDAAIDFIQRGQEYGFHIAPHFNALEIDPSHHLFDFVRDFQYRHISTKEILGWGWDGAAIPVPSSNHQLTRNRSLNVMAKIHPGLKMWQSILMENMAKPVQQLKLDTVFFDVALATFNLHNCLVDNMTPTEGLHVELQQISKLSNGLVLAGEGLNEITAQTLSFAQVHLFRSYHDTISGLEGIGCPLNHFLFSKLTRSFGYSRLGGHTEEEKLRMRAHEAQGAIPTITIHSADELDEPNVEIQQMLKSVQEQH